MTLRFEKRILKFVDDPVTISLLNNDESSLSPVVDGFLKWCSEAFELNVTKTKVMCIDFKRNVPGAVRSVINGRALETVKSFKYLW